MVASGSNSSCVQSGGEPRQGGNDTNILQEQPLHASPGPLPSQLLRSSAPQTLVQSHPGLVIRHASSQAGALGGTPNTLLVLGPTGQNTG